MSSSRQWSQGTFKKELCKTLNSSAKLLCTGLHSSAQRCTEKKNYKEKRLPGGEVNNIGRHMILICVILQFINSMFSWRCRLGIYFVHSMLSHLRPFGPSGDQISQIKETQAGFEDVAQ